MVTVEDTQSEKCIHECHKGLVQADIDHEHTKITIRPQLGKQICYGLHQQTQILIWIHSYRDFAETAEFTDSSISKMHMIGITGASCTGKGEKMRNVVNIFIIMINMLIAVAAHIVRISIRTVGVIMEVGGYFLSYVSMVPFGVVVLGTIVMLISGNTENFQKSYFINGWIFSVGFLVGCYLLPIFGVLITDEFSEFVFSLFPRIPLLPAEKQKGAAETRL